MTGLLMLATVIVLGRLAVMVRRTLMVLGRRFVMLAAMMGLGAHWAPPAVKTVVGERATRLIQLSDMRLTCM
jgi:hypothetical protein